MGILCGEDQRSWTQNLLKLRSEIPTELGARNQKSTTANKVPCSMDYDKPV